MLTVPTFKLQALKSLVHHFYLYNINGLIKMFKNVFVPLGPLVVGKGGNCLTYYLK